jgi:uncharacterized protein with PIN domain
MNHYANLTFHEELNDFLSSGPTVLYYFNDAPAIKDAIEAIGVPHVEIGCISVNGSTESPTYRLQNGDSVQVFPQLLNERYWNRLPLQNGFIADVHLGSLTRYLRMLGFDVLFDKTLTEAEIAGIASAEERIVLTRSVNLLKYKVLNWGYHLRSEQTKEQLAEVIRRFNLAEKINPFSRCLVCNGLIEPVPKSIIEDQLPPDTHKYFNEFRRCVICRRIYWKGSHYERMLKLIDRIKNVS